MPEDARGPYSEAGRRRVASPGDVEGSWRMRVISLLSEKGGVGKSTATVNIAVALTELGCRVLVIDLDGVACSTMTLDGPTEWLTSIATCLSGEQEIATLIRPTHLPGLDLVPGSPGLKSLEEQWVFPASGTLAAGLAPDVLQHAIASLEGRGWDLVLIDCPGGNLVMGRLALMASDEVIVPTGMSVFDLTGAVFTCQNILEVQQVRGGKPELLGFLPIGTSARGVPRRFQDEFDRFNLPCLTPIRESKKLRSIAGNEDARKRILVTSDPDNAASHGFRQVAREIWCGLAQAREVEGHANQAQEGHHEHVD